MTHPIMRLAKNIIDRGGTPVLVGGRVRDMVMQGLSDPFLLEDGDYDIEVFGLAPPRLKMALYDSGYDWDEVGEHFSVLKVRASDIEGTVDVSIPRYETSTGDGHKDFDVMINPELTFEEASRRRDFTMNAMGWNLADGTLLDPHDGASDARSGYILHTSAAFSEDPLRPLRAARFAARFGGMIDPETLGVCGSMSDMAKSLPSERVWGELEKALLEGTQVSKFFFYLDTMGWLEILFPEVAALRGVVQDPGWHPEGDVFTHTMCALDYWAENLQTGNREDDLVVAAAILCHDFGKVTATAWNEKKGRITSYGHEEAGAEPARSLLHRLRQYELAKEVVPLVENHLAPVYSYPISSKAVRRLSTKVKRLDLLAIVSRADQAGRPPKDPEDGFYKITQFEEKVANLDIPQGGPKPLVDGYYLIELGLKPGPYFKKVLDAAYDYQLETGCGVMEAENFARDFIHYDDLP